MIEEREKIVYKIFELLNSDAEEDKRILDYFLGYLDGIKLSQKLKK